MCWDWWRQTQGLQCHKVQNLLGLSFIRVSTVYRKWCDKPTNKNAVCSSLCDSVIGKGQRILARLDEVKRCYSFKGECTSKVKPKHLTPPYLSLQQMNTVSVINSSYSMFANGTSAKLSTQSTRQINFQRRFLSFWVVLVTLMYAHMMTAEPGLQLSRTSL